MEEIDLALDQPLLGFEGEFSPQNIQKLKKASHGFMPGEFVDELRLKLAKAGLG